MCQGARVELASKERAFLARLQTFVALEENVAVQRDVRNQMSSGEGWRGRAAKEGMFSVKLANDT